MGPTSFEKSSIHVQFKLATLANVFSKVFQTLSHSDGTAPSQYISSTQALSAFNAALSQHGIATGATLDLSTAADRAEILQLLESAIANLETSLGMKFNKTTLIQL